MSRRKQAKPRSLKREEGEDEWDGPRTENPEDPAVEETAAATNDSTAIRDDAQVSAENVVGPRRRRRRAPSEATEDNALDAVPVVEQAFMLTEETDPTAGLDCSDHNSLDSEALGSDPGSTSSWRSTDTVVLEDDVRSLEEEEEDLDEDAVSAATAAPVPGERQIRRGVVATSAAAAAGASGVKVSRRSVSSASSSSVCSSGSHSSSVPGAPEEDLGFTLGVTEATPYPCQFCAKAFPRLSYLKKHEQSHAEHMPFRCEFCARLFKHKRSRDRHVKLHTGDRKYRCTQCEAAFSRSDHLKIHMKTHDTQKPFQCSACNRGYNTAAALTSHSQTHKRPPSLPASLPPRSSPHQQQTLSRSPPSISTPTRRVTPAPSPVPVFPRNLQPPGTTHHDLLRAHPAAAAAAAVLFNRELQQVLQQQQEANARGGASPPSARSALNAAAMAAAALAHSAGLQFAAPTLACIYCTKDSFTSMESLQLHVQAMHGSILNGEIREYQPPSPAHHVTSVGAKHAASPTQPFSCDFCTMKFDNVQGLQKHSLAVHAMPAPPAPAALPLACAQCPAQFSSPGQHAEHVAMYHAEQLKPTDLSKKPAATNGKSSRSEKLPQNTLLCSQCNAPFPDFESFRTHLKTHLDAEHGKSSHTKRNIINNNIPPHYQCTECEASFTTENALEIHSLGHFLKTTTEFSCQSCLKSFQRPDELQKHLMDIHAHHLYRCALCREIFDSRVGAQVHFAVKHSNETRVLRCVACGDNSVKFRTEMEFTLHVRVHHLNPAHLEAQTMRQTTSKPELNTPLPNQFRCIYCNDCYKNETELQYHIVNFHQKLFRCKICDEAFHVEFLLDKHIETEHSSSSSGEKIINNTDSQIDNKKHQNGEKELIENKKSINFSSSMKQNKSPSNNMVVVSLVCAYCNENCKSRSELEAHMKSHHQNRTTNGTSHSTNITGIGRHKCNICDQVCPTSTILAEHKLTTHCKVLHSDQCSICKSSLANEEQFFVHMQKHCPNNTGKNENLTLPSACIICRQTVTSDAEVQLHAKFHLHQKLQEYCTNTKEDFSLTCTECTSIFESVSELDMHYANFHTTNINTFRMPKNRGRESYECISCQLSFGTEQEVRSHVESIHSSDSTQRCHLCQESFDTPLKLQCHLIEHTFAGCPTFACYLCGAVFTASTGLQRHMVSHGPNSKPYDCNKCHLKFYFRSELENHTFIHDQNLSAVSNEMESLHNNIKSEEVLYGDNEDTKIKNEITDDVQDTTDHQLEAISLTNRKRKANVINDNTETSKNGIDNAISDNGDDPKRMKSEADDK